MASKQLTRTEFLKLSAGLISVGAMPFTLGCPGDDTSDDGADSGNASTSSNPSTTSSSSDSTTDTPGTTIDPDSTSGEPPGTDSTSTSTPPGTDSSSSGDDSTTAASACTMDPDVTIGTNHGHELVVPLADVMAGVEVDYDIQGTSMHPHTVTLTADHFMMLQQGMEVVVDSTNDNGHTHQVTVRCG